jgi:hypothetical protein
MIELHPEIVKFWEDQGYDCSNLERRYNTIFAHKGNQSTMRAICYEFDYGNWVYFINGVSKRYTEKEILRLIKLKAFL